MLVSFVACVTALHEAVARPCAYPSEPIYASVCTIRPRGAFGMRWSRSDEAVVPPSLPANAAPPVMPLIFFACLTDASYLMSFKAMLADSPSPWRMLRSISCTRTFSPCDTVGAVIQSPA